MELYRIFTLEAGQVTPGAIVKTLKMSWGDLRAVVIGSEGRGRSLGIVPVTGDYLDGLLVAAGLGTLQSGKPKLIAVSEGTMSSEAAIVVLRTPIGFRGGNSHTGDRLPLGEPVACPHRGQVVMWRGTCGKCGVKLIPGEEGWMRDTHPPDVGVAPAPLTFKPFPGQILATGRIAQGDAGWMGAGDQYVVLMPREVVFRTAYSGKLYGRPSEHYYVFDGSKVHACTSQERELAELGDYPAWVFPE
jgi:hypothetical protein